MDIKRNQIEKGFIKSGGRTIRRFVKQTKPLDTQVSDEKKLNEITGKIGGKGAGRMTEVNMFTEDDKILHFSNPIVYAGKQGSFFGVVGTPETKKIEEMMPNIIPQLDQNTLAKLRESFEKEEKQKQEEIISVEAK